MKEDMWTYAFSMSCYFKWRIMPKIRRITCTDNWHQIETFTIAYILSSNTVTVTKTDYEKHNIRETTRKSEKQCGSWTKQLWTTACNKQLWTTARNKQPVNNSTQCVGIIYWGSMEYTDKDCLAKGKTLIYVPRRDISNNVVCATSKASDQPAHTRSLIRVFASRLNSLTSVALLAEHHLEFVSLKGGRTGSSESTLVKIPHSWKPHVLAHMC